LEKHAVPVFRVKKKFPYKHTITYIFLKHMGPYVGVTPKIAIMVPILVFWSKFSTEHACGNLETVFFSFIYLMSSRHQHNEIQILGNNQLDALFHVSIYFMSLHVSSVTALIIRRSNCINTSPGMISLC